MSPVIVFTWSKKHSLNRYIMFLKVCVYRPTYLSKENSEFQIQCQSYINCKHDSMGSKTLPMV